MTKYPFAETRLNQILFGVFLAAMLYLARDTLVTTAILGFSRGQFLMLGIMALGVLVFLIYNRRNWREILRDRRITVLLAYTLILLLPMVGKRDWQMMYISVLLCLYFAVFLTFFTTVERTAKCFVLILAAVGAYSVVATYVLRLLPKRGILDIPVFYNAIGVDFYNFFFSFVSIDYCANRNFGIFREPGVYQYFVMLALVANNYLIIWDRPWKQWLLNGVLAVVMLSTLAIGGYVEMFLLALVLFLDKKLYRNRFVCILVLLLITGAVGIVLYSWQAKNQLWWEIYAMTVSKFAEGETSGTDRLASLALNLHYFLKNPILGGKIGEVLNSMENNTSSTTLMFAMFGILGGTIHVAGWFALLWKKEFKIWVRLGLGLVMAMSFNTQNLIADVFLWLLPTMALTETLGARPFPLQRGRKAFGKENEENGKN